MKAIARISTPISFARGRLCRFNPINRSTPQNESKTPNAPAARVISRFSVMNCRAKCRRVAPSAERTANSRWRAVTWASSRLPTLAQATSSKNPTATKIIISAPRTFPTMYSCCGISPKSTASMSLPCSCLSCLPMVLTSARACSILMAGRTRATTCQLWAEREVSGTDISRGIQTSVLYGKPKPAGITPTTLKLRSEILSAVPVKSDFPPNIRRQKS